MNHKSRLLNIYTGVNPVNGPRMDRKRSDNKLRTIREDRLQKELQKLAHYLGHLGKNRQKCIKKRKIISKNLHICNFCSTFALRISAHAYERAKSNPVYLSRD